MHEPENASSGANAAANDSERARRFALVTVFLVVVVDLLGFGIVLPLLPLYAIGLL